MFLNFGAIYLNFGAINLNFGAMYFNFGQNHVFSKGMGGEGEDPPVPPGGFVIVVGKRCFGHPLYFGGVDSPPEPLVDGLGAVRYEVSRIANKRIHKGQTTMMMIAFITIKGGFLIKGLCAQIFYFRFEIIGGFAFTSFA